MKRNGVLVIGLACLLLAGLWLAAAPLSAAPAATTRYVAPGASCGGPTPCYASLQAAVDAAASGDEIRVAAGTYAGVSTREGQTQMAYISKTITIRGGYTTSNWTTPNAAANVATLDAGGAGRVFFVSGSIAVTVEGLRITNGTSGSGFFPYNSGGGLLGITATLTLSNNVIVSNTASFLGGGVYLNSVAGTLSGNTLISNTVPSGSGGGFGSQSSDVTLTANLVQSNTATSAGGIFMQFCGFSAVSGNRILSNTATFGGGGVSLSVCSAPLIGNVIMGNAAGTEGGGLWMSFASGTATNNVVAENSAPNGAGVYLVRGTPSFYHNTVARNTGDGVGIAVSQQSTLTSTLFAYNTILVDQTIGVSVSISSTATLNGVLWFGNGSNTGGAGPIALSNQVTGDPKFAADGYHIQDGSAARDAGVVVGTATDIDGEPRNTALPDIGADEIAIKVFLPVVLK